MSRNNHKKKFDSGCLSEGGLATPKGKVNHTRVLLLRRDFAQAIKEHEQNVVSADDVLAPIINHCSDEDVWFEALMMPWHRSGFQQDLPIIECAKRNHHALIEAIFAWSPLSASQRAEILDADGVLGQNALQVAVGYGKVQSARVLVSLGADLGVDSKSLRILSNLHSTAKMSRSSIGSSSTSSWSDLDKRMFEVFSTMSLVHGDDWRQRVSASSDISPQNSWSDFTPFGTPSRDSKELVMYQVPRRTPFGTPSRDSKEVVMNQVPQPRDSKEVVINQAPRLDQKSAEDLRDLVLSQDTEDHNFNLTMDNDDHSSMADENWLPSLPERSPSKKPT